MGSMNAQDQDLQVAMVIRKSEMTKLFRSISTQPFVEVVYIQ